MAFYHRPIQPKEPRIIDPRFIAYYRHDYGWCEYCIHRLGKYNTQYLELHHIRGGLYRHDTIENVIMLCHDHHVKATIHVNGAEAVAFNEILIQIKKDKGDIK